MEEKLEQLGLKAVESQPGVNSEQSPNNEKVVGKCWMKRRYLIAIMAFLCMCTFQIMRISISVAVVAMVNFTDDTTSNQSTLCQSNEEADEAGVQVGEFAWTKTQVGTLLASYYFIYPISTLLAGYVGTRFGARIVVGSGMVLASILTILCPFAARLGFVHIVIMRALVGLLQGPCPPGMHCLFSKWCPPLERSLMASMAQAGTNFGVTVIMPIAGALADHFGWESVFYFSGGVAGIYSIAFFCIVYSSPEDDPRISEEEKIFIVNSITGKANEKSDGARNVPWCSILTSLPFWAMVISVSASNWGDYVVIAMLPSYMTVVLGYNLSTMGMLASLPFMVNFTTMLSTGYLTDVIRRRKLMSTTAVRKLNTTLGLVGPAFFLVVAVNVGCNITAAVALFTVSVGFAGFMAPGAKSNSLDIAPPYSGILWGFTVCISNVFGLVSIQLAGLMLDIDNSVAQWKHVFWLAAAVYSSGAVFYLLFGSGMVQPWADYTKNEMHTERKHLSETTSCEG